MDLVIRNGTVVTAGEISHADVGIEAGLVKQIGKDLGPAAKEIDASGCYLFPGGSGRSYPRRYRTDGPPFGGRLLFGYGSPLHVAA